MHSQSHAFYDQTAPIYTIQSSISLRYQVRQLHIVRPTNHFVTIDWKINQMYTDYVISNLMVSYTH